MSSPNDPCIRGNIRLVVGLSLAHKDAEYTHEVILRGHEDIQIAARTPQNLLPKDSAALREWRNAKPRMKSCSFVPASPEDRNAWFTLSTAALLEEGVSRA